MASLDFGFWNSAHIVRGSLHGLDKVDEFVDNSIPQVYTLYMEQVEEIEAISIESANKTNEQTDWHRLLGALLQALLSAVGIIVQIEVPLVRKALKLDILLLRRQGHHWTEAQFERLPES